MVHKVPKAILGTFFFLSFLFFATPIISMIFTLYWNLPLKMGHFIAFFVFGILGFYLLRIALWNSYGRELIIFRPGQFEYVANYKWFEDGKKSIEYKSIHFLSESIPGDMLHGKLLIIHDGNAFECATKIPNSELNTIIQKLNSRI